MNEVLTSAAEFLRPYLYQISVAITAALLVLFGHHINGFIRDSVKNFNFLIRLTVFILIVTFGYGALSFFLSHVLSSMISQIPKLYLCPVLILTFIIIGVIAEEKKHI